MDGCVCVCAHAGWHAWMHEYVHACTHTCMQFSSAPPLGLCVLQRSWQPRCLRFASTTLWPWCLCHRCGSASCSLLGARRRAQARAALPTGAVAAAASVQGLVATEQLLAEHTTAAEHVLSGSPAVLADAPAAVQRAGVCRCFFVRLLARVCVCVHALCGEGMLRRGVVLAP
eukprot:364897-Chlamydomonas_euryale.AAC.10